MSKGKLTKAEEVIANQLQVSRILGTTDTLGEKHDIPQLQHWARGIATMLTISGFNLTEAGRKALESSHDR